MVTDSTSQTDDTTAFLRAARSGNLEKVIEYLDTDLDINTANSNGLNALHLASKDGHVEIVTELLKRGAKVDAATKKGNTALHIASLAGQEEIVNILIQYGGAVNIQSQNGFTPLYMAAQENHDQVVKLLLSNGANQSLATEDGFTPLAVAMQQGHERVVSVLLENDSKGKVRLPALHIAAKKDDCKAADLLLQNDHKPDVTSKSGFTPLHIAAHYGNEEIARLLIKRGADVNYLAKHNISPLHVAAKWGKNNMVKILLENSAMIDAKTRDGLTPLHCAARSGHEEAVSTLLEHEAPISARTKNGLAPLHMASQGDHVDAARVLLYHRAPVDEVTIDYLTSLHVAAHCGHVRVAKLLLDRKADPNARALNGFTPLHIACKKNRIKVVELLLKHGASIESTTESGLTPLHVASFMGCMNIVIFLLQHEANPDVPTVRGETPLHLAARANQTDIIRILLRNGAKVDARAREEQTPLHIASRLGNVDIVMLLLQHGAAVDTTTKDMYTALHIAAKEGQEEVAAILVENHASVKAATKNGFTPLHIAAKYGNMNVAKILLQKDSKLDAQGKNDITPLHLACHYDHANVANMILDKGASPHLSSQNGHTPLHIAARKNQMDIASTLLEHGADPNVQSKAGFTPLQLSAQKGHYDMTNLLIEHGADPNHKAKNGLTALHLCAQEDFIRVASILVKNGANVESETETGYRPIHVAAHFGNLSMIRFLLKHNAQIDVRTNQNYTPLHQAAQQGHAHIVSALLEGNASHNARTTDGLTALNVAQKLGYISVMEVLKGLSYDTLTPDNRTWEEKYKVIAPESLQENSFMSDSDDEGGSDALINEQPYRYLTADLMKSLRDDSLPIDVTRDDPIHRQVSKEEKQEFVQSNNYCLAENFDTHDSASLAFLVSFLVDARGGAMKGCRHSGIRIIVPPRRATMPIRVTCRLIKPSKVANPPSLMEGEAMATRIIEMGPVGASFLGPVLIDVPHFASVQGKEREIIILRSENGETWKEHDNSPDNDDTLFNTPHDPQMSTSHSGRITRILTTEFPQYFAIVSRIKQEVHVIGADGGILISSVANHVQAVFPPGALTKKIKVGLQAHVIPAELTAKLLGNCVAVSPVITIEPRRRKFHKPITLTIPVPQAANKGMINNYAGETPTLRLLCSIAGGTSEAQWEDVTGSTPLTFMNDRVSFTTTVSARFWLMDCRNISEVPKMATDLYKESLFVPFITNFVIYTKRLDILEATLRILCMTDGKDGIHTLERQEEFLEIVKSRDVEALDGKDLFIEFSGNLVPVTKSGMQLKFTFKAFRQNRLSFHVKVRDPLLDPVARMMFMKDPKVAKGEPSQQPICVLNIVLPDSTVVNESDKKLKEYEDSNLKGRKEDRVKSSYARDEDEKGDKPKPSSPSESKFITDILQKEQTDAATIHDSFAQKAACPLESVDASYPSNLSVHDDLSPDIEKQTYTEKRKFWEDITRKRENYQRSESELSRTSQLTMNESDSECCVQNIVSEEETAEAIPERSETMEDLNIPDISECSVAEKAHYFEEQIQKELSTARPTSKLISQDSVKDKDFEVKGSDKIVLELSADDDPKGEKEDWNFAESMKTEQIPVVGDEELRKEKLSSASDVRVMEKIGKFDEEKMSRNVELRKEKVSMESNVKTEMKIEKMLEEKIMRDVELGKEKISLESCVKIGKFDEEKLLRDVELQKENISTSSDVKIKEIIGKFDEEKVSKDVELRKEKVSTSSDVKMKEMIGKFDEEKLSKDVELRKEKVSTSSDVKMKEMIGKFDEEKLSKDVELQKEKSSTSSDVKMKEMIRKFDEEKLSKDVELQKEKSSTSSDVKIKEIIGKFDEEKMSKDVELQKEKMSTSSDVKMHEKIGKFDNEKMSKDMELRESKTMIPSDEKITTETISTCEDKKSPKETISKFSDGKSPKKIISTLDDEKLKIEKPSTIEKSAGETKPAHQESFETEKPESKKQTTDSKIHQKTETFTKSSEEKTESSQKILKLETESLEKKFDAKPVSKIDDLSSPLIHETAITDETTKKSERTKIPSKIPELKKSIPTDVNHHKKICDEFLHHEKRMSTAESTKMRDQESIVTGDDAIIETKERIVVEGDKREVDLQKTPDSVASIEAGPSIVSKSDEPTKLQKDDSPPSMIPRKTKPDATSKDAKKVSPDETMNRRELVEPLRGLETEEPIETDRETIDKESTSPSEKVTLKMQEEAKMTKKESRIPKPASKMEKDKPIPKSPSSSDEKTSENVQTPISVDETILSRQTESSSSSSSSSTKDVKSPSPMENVTSPKKEFESRIPKRTAIGKLPTDKKDAEKNVETIVESRTMEKTSSQNYQKHKSEMKTKIVSKSSFVGGSTIDGKMMIEKMEKDSSIVTSKIDEKASTEITEISSIVDPTKSPEITIKHEETESKHVEKLSESTTKKSTPLEIVEEKKLESTKLQSSIVEEISLISKNGKEAVDAQASQSTILEKDAQKVQSLTNEIATFVEATDSKSVKARESEAVLKIEKNEPINIQDEMKNASTIERKFEETTVTNEKTILPTKLKSEESVKNLNDKNDGEFVPQTLHEREDQMMKELEARNIAETIIDSIQTEIAKRSASLEGIKHFDNSESASDSKSSENILDMDTKESEVFHDRIADDLTKKFENMMDRRSTSHSEIIVEKDALPERSRSMAIVHDDNHEKMSNRGSISVSEDLTKDEESTPRDREESFSSSLMEPQKLADRDITVSPSSISDHTDLEMSMESEKSVTQEPAKRQMDKRSSDDVRSARSVTSSEIDEVPSFPRNRETIDRESDHQSRQDSIDVPSLEIDEPRSFGLSDIVDNSSSSYDRYYDKPAEFSSIHESPAVESLDKICLDRDITMSPSTISDDTNIDFSLVQDQFDRKSDGKGKKLENIIVKNLETDEIESPSVISPRLRLKELEIKPVNWMIGDEKIEVSEFLQPSQAFDKELDEYQTTIMRQQSQTPSRAESADFEQESGTRSSDDLSAIDSVREALIGDCRTITSAKTTKFTVVPVNETDFDNELVESRLEVSCQELVDTLQREYEAKTPTENREIEGTRYTFDTENPESTEKPETMKKVADLTVNMQPILLQSSESVDPELETTGELPMNVPKSIEPQQFERDADESISKTIDDRGKTNSMNLEESQIIDKSFGTSSTEKSAGAGITVNVAMEIAEAECQSIEDTSMIVSGDDFVVGQVLQEKSVTTIQSDNEKQKESTKIVLQDIPVKMETTKEAERTFDSSKIDNYESTSIITSVDKTATDKIVTQITDEKSGKIDSAIVAEKSITKMEDAKESRPISQHSDSESVTKPSIQESGKSMEVIKIVGKTDDPKADVSLKGLKQQTSPSKSTKSSIDDSNRSEKSSDASVFKLKKEDLPSVDLSARYAQTVLDQVVKKEIAEVKESLEAAKQDLIEELNENSETIFQIKESPSEFQFKLEPESIPNDLPFLYTAPSIEHESTSVPIDGSPIAKPRKHADSKTDDLETSKIESIPSSIVTDDRDDEKIQSIVVQTDTTVKSSEKIVQMETIEPDIKSKISVQRDSSVEATSTEESRSHSVPIAASRTNSDVEIKEEASGFLAPQPAPRRRHKTARVSRKLTSESDAGSSSGDSSNYQSCDYEIGSGSRPSSSDIEALHSTLPSGTISEYESALMSIERSSTSRPTSQDYQSAVGTLSSRESMKSLNSLSSGHLGSIDSTGELSETLVASEDDDANADGEDDDDEDDKDHIDVNIECILDDDNRVAKASDSSSSEIPMEDAFDKIDDGLPCRMKRSSEMIFQQIIDEAAAEGATVDEEIGMEEETRFDECTTEQLPSDTLAEDEEAFKTDSIFMSTDLTSEAYDKSMSSMESKTDVPDGQPDTDIHMDLPLLDTHLEADEDADSLDRGKQIVDTDLDDTPIPLTSVQTLLHQASTTSSTSGAMSFETVIEKDAKNDRHSPDSDSFELVDRPDIIDDFVVIEEVGKEAEEFDSEGKSIVIGTTSQTIVKKYDRDLENLITENIDKNETACQQIVRTTEVFDFESEESPPQASNDEQLSQSLSDDENFEGSKKWLEMQFQNDPRGYDMDYDRGRLEDIKEEEITDFEAGSSRFGSMGSHKGSIGSVGSMRGSYGSATDYDVLVGKKNSGKSTDHDNVSLSSLQEFEHLETAVAMENSKKFQCGSQDSVNNGSLPRRYTTGRSGHGDDVSLSSLKDFEGLEKACREAHLIELRAREEEDLLDHESPENRYKLENLPRPKIAEPTSAGGSFNPSTSGSDDYEKRIMEIDEIIRIAQANVEKFDRQDDTTEDISQIEITADAEKMETVVDVAATSTDVDDNQRIVGDANVMETSTDSLELDDNADKRCNPLCRSSDSLEMKTTIDFPSLSSDSLNNVRDNREIAVDTSGDAFNSGRRISSDSLEMPVVEQPDGDSRDKSSDSHGSYNLRESFDDSVEQTTTDTKITNNGKNRSPSTSDT